MRAGIARIGCYSLGLLMAVVSVEGHLIATVTPVPEIDGGSLSVGLGLLTAGVLILRSRRRKN